MEYNKLAIVTIQVVTHYQYTSLTTSGIVLQYYDDGATTSRSLVIVNYDYRQKHQDATISSSSESCTDTITVQCQYIHSEHHIQGFDTFHINTLPWGITWTKHM